MMCPACGDGVIIPHSQVQKHDRVIHTGYCNQCGTEFTTWHMISKPHSISDEDDLDMEL